MSFIQSLTQSVTGVAFFFVYATPNYYSAVKNIALYRKVLFYIKNCLHGTCFTLPIFCQSVYLSVIIFCLFSYLSINSLLWTSPRYNKNINEHLKITSIIEIVGLHHSYRVLTSVLHITIITRTCTTFFAQHTFL